MKLYLQIVQNLIMIWSQCCCSSPARPIEAAEFALVQSGDECLSGQFRLSLITHSFCFSVKCLISILYNREVRTLRSFQHILHASWASAASDYSKTTVKTTSSPPERKVLTFNGFYPFFFPPGGGAMPVRMFEPNLISNQTYHLLSFSLMTWRRGSGVSVCVDNINIVWCCLMSHVYSAQSWPCLTSLSCVCGWGSHWSSGAVKSSAVWVVLCVSPSSSFFFFCFLAVWTSLTSSCSSCSSGLMCSWDQGPFARLRTFWNNTHSMGWMGKRGALTSLPWKVTQLLLFLLLCLGSPPLSQSKPVIFTHLCITTAFILNLQLFV